MEVLVGKGLHGAIGFHFAQNLINGFLEFLVAFAQTHGDGLVQYGAVVHGAAGQFKVGTGRFAQKAFDGVLGFLEGRVNTATGQVIEGVGVAGVSHNGDAIIGPVLAGIGFHGGALLHAYTFAFQGFYGRLQATAFTGCQANRHDVQGLGKVDDLGACLSSGHGGVGQVEFAGLQAGNQAVKGLVDPDALGVQALTDLVADVDVKTLQLAAGVQILKRRVACFSGKADLGGAGRVGSRC